ncbi:MAG: hypothetical protein AAF224_10655 [Pseudomonadota bacterium]
MRLALLLVMRAPTSDFEGIGVFAGSGGLRPFFVADDGRFSNRRAMGRLRAATGGGNLRTGGEQAAAMG